MGLCSSLDLLLAVKPMWPTFWKCQVCNEWSALQIQDSWAWWSSCMHNCEWQPLYINTLIWKKESVCVSASLLVLVSEAIEENGDCKLLFFISFMCHCFVERRMRNLALTLGQINGGKRSPNAMMLNIPLQREDEDGMTGRGIQRRWCILGNEVLFHADPKKKILKILNI